MKKKKLGIVLCYNMDEPWKCDVKWKSQKAKYYDSIYMKCAE